MSKPILFNTTASPATLNLATQGNGALTDVISCTVTEERNGAYELEMTYPIDGIHFSEIEQRSLIFAKPNYTDDLQLFRVYKITKPLNGICTVYAQHISYDLSGMIIPAGASAISLTTAVTLLNSYSGDFTIASTKTGASAFKVDVPSSVRSWLGGKQGSFLDLYGGEWHFDNFICTLSTARGQNRGVTIRYGKNLTDLTQEASSENLYTAVRCFYKDRDNNVTTGNDVQTGITLDTARVYVVDASQHFGQTVPTVQQLTDYAQTYIDANNLTIPAKNITLDFVQLQGLSERVDLCDTVSIYYEKLGVSATAKCIATTWDVLQERYTGCEFGSARSTLAETINGIRAEMNDSVDYLNGNISDAESVLEQAITNATEAITGNLGGYVVIRDSDNDSKPDEILIMDTPSIATATKVWRWNQAGLGYSSNGYSGPYELAMTADGEIVANFITTGTMTADRIRGGELKLGGYNDQYGIMQVYNDQDGLELKIAKNGMYVYRNGVFAGQFTNLDERITISCGAIITSTDIRFNRGTVESENWTRGYRFFKDPANGFRAYTADENIYANICQSTYGGRTILKNLTGSNRVSIGVDSNDAGNLLLYNSNGTATVSLYGSSGNAYIGNAYISDEDVTQYRIRPIMKKQVSDASYNGYCNYDTGLSAATYTVLSARTSNNSANEGSVLVPFVAYGNWWLKALSWYDLSGKTGTINTTIYYIKQA